MCGTDMQGLHQRHTVKTAGLDFEFAMQEIEILKSLSFDRNIVQFYGTCPWNGKTMLVLEYMEVLLHSWRVLTSAHCV